MRRNILKWLAALSAVTLLAACGGGGGDTATPTTGTTGSSATVASAAAEQADLSTLNAAVSFVDEGSDDKLAPALAADGEMTLFAPSNAAFDKLAEEMIGPGKKGTDLLKPEYKDDVRDIIKNHILVGQAIKSSMGMNSSVSTYLDVSATITITITITIANGVLTITDGQGRVCKATLKDIFTRNGILHIVDCIIMPPKPMIGKSIVAIASATPSLSSLVAALGFASDKGDLVKLLSKKGTYTVFAPTNDAFDALAVELLGAGKNAKDLLVPANQALVRAVLQYHVLGAVVPKAAIPLGKPIDPLLEGKDFFKIDAVEGKIIITDGRNRKSEITATDIKAKNGVVHLINKVILPADKDIVDTAIASKPEFSILVEAVVAAGLADALKAPGTLTVLAPTNAAFVSLLDELHITKEALLADKALLTKVLTYHVIPSLVLKADVPVGTPVKTLQGDTLTVDANFKITDQRGRISAIVITDVLTKNGVIHAIDKVILPKP